MPSSRPLTKKRHRTSREMDDPGWWVVSLKRGKEGVILITPERDTLRYGVQLQFPATNNEAEYEAILMGLKVKKALVAINILL